MTNSDIDTIDGIAGFEVLALIDDGINRDSGFTGLTVTDDQFALSTSDGDHGVDTLESGGQRFGNGLSVDYARRFTVEGHEIFFALDVTTTVEGISQRVDDTAEHVLIDHNRGDAAGAFHAVSFFNAFGRTENHGTDVVLFEVHGYCHYAVVEFDQLVFCHFAESVDASYAVTNGKDSAYFLKLNFCGDILKLL